MGLSSMRLFPRFATLLETRTKRQSQRGQRTIGSLDVVAGGQTPFTSLSSFRACPLFSVKILARVSSVSGCCYRILCLAPRLALFIHRLTLVSNNMQDHGKKRKALSLSAGGCGTDLQAEGRTIKKRLEEGEEKETQSRQ